MDNNIFNPIYRQDYIAGYATGSNPFLELVECEKNNAAILSGFNCGRLKYESLNGPVSEGIPLRIVTDKILEEFLLAGMLGMNIDAQDYTPFQIHIIEKWYQNGIDQYDPNQNIYLLAILEKNSISTM